MGLHRFLVLPAAGIEDMDETAMQDGLERLVCGMFSGNVPGLGSDDTPVS